MFFMDQYSKLCNILRMTHRLTFSKGLISLYFYLPFNVYTDRVLALVAGLNALFYFILGFLSKMNHKIY